MDYSAYGTTDYAGSNAPMFALTGSVFLVTMVIVIGLAVLTIVAYWKIFTKAGVPGWGAIVPFYNSYLLFKITFGIGWLFLLTLVPFVNFVVSILLLYKLGAVFGHGIGFFFGMLFLSPIFILILAFEPSEYIGPA